MTLVAAKRGEAADVRFALLGGLIDHAPTFPPAELPLADALDAHMSARRGPNAWVLGSLVLPASRLEDAAGLAGGFGRLPALSVVCDSASGSRPGDFDGALVVDVDRVLHARHLGARVTSVEVALARVEDVGAVVHAFDFGSEREHCVWLELPTHADADRRAAALASLPGCGLKLRCGGPSQDRVPSTADVAAVLAACARSDVAFKATAGLHHAVRGPKKTSGLRLHGFLNLLAAALAARRGAAVAPLVAETSAVSFSLDTDGFRAGGHTFGLGEIAAMRSGLLRSFGSCSFDEPVEELAALGMLRP